MHTQLRWKKLKRDLGDLDVDGIHLQFSSAHITSRPHLFKQVHLQHIYIYMLFPRLYMGKDSKYIQLVRRIFRRGSKIQVYEQPATQLKERIYNTSATSIFGVGPENAKMDRINMA